MKNRSKNKAIPQMDLQEFKKAYAEFEQALKEASMPYKAGVSILAEIILWLIFYESLKQLLYFSVNSIETDLNIQSIEKDLNTPLEEITKSLDTYLADPNFSNTNHYQQILALRKSLASSSNRFVGCTANTHSITADDIIKLSSQAVYKILMANKEDCIRSYGLIFPIITILLRAFRKFSSVDFIYPVQICLVSTGPTFQYGMGKFIERWYKQTIEENISGLSLALANPEELTINEGAQLITHLHLKTDKLKKQTALNTDIARKITFLILAILLTDIIYSYTQSDENLLYKVHAGKSLGIFGFIFDAMLLGLISCASVNISRDFKHSYQQQQINHALYELEHFIRAALPIKEDRIENIRGLDIARSYIQVIFDLLQKEERAKFKITKKVLFAHNITFTQKNSMLLFSANQILPDTRSHLTPAITIGEYLPTALHPESNKFHIYSQITEGMEEYRAKKALKEQLFNLLTKLGIDSIQLFTYPSNHAIKSFCKEYQFKVPEEFTTVVTIEILQKIFTSASINLNDYGYICLKGFEPGNTALFAQLLRDIENAKKPKPAPKKTEGGLKETQPETPKKTDYLQKATDTENDDNNNNNNLSPSKLNNDEQDWPDEIEWKIDGKTIKYTKNSNSSATGVGKLQAPQTWEGGKVYFSRFELEKTDFPSDAIYQKHFTQSKQYISNRQGTVISPEVNNGLNNSTLFAAKTKIKSKSGGIEDGRCYAKEIRSSSHNGKFILLNFDHYESSTHVSRKNTK